MTGPGPLEGTDSLRPAGLELIGADAVVPLVTGDSVRALDFDRAATTPCLVAVREAVDELLPFYGAPARGAGYKARLTTERLEAARAEVARFVGAGPGDRVVFVRNTTEATNLLAHLVAGRVDVVAFEFEHHADLLPWRRIGARVLPTPASPGDLLDEVASLARSPRCRPLLVALTGASNVTGELLPLEAAARILHEAGDARLFVDAAQLAPHRRIALGELGADYLALSGHKLYAPFGAGALIGAADWLEEGEPMLLGGGAARLVTDAEVLWKRAPDRLEAGTANVVGAVALGAACDALGRAGMDRIAAAEAALTTALDDALATVPGLRRLSMWDGAERIGVSCFTIEGRDHGLVAAALDAEHGIGVRHGCFCAHLLVRDLLGVTVAESHAAAGRLVEGHKVVLPGAVRASIGLGTGREDLSRLAGALGAISVEGPRWRYERGEDDEYVPVPDPRPGIGD